MKTRHAARMSIWLVLAVAAPLFAQDPSPSTPINAAGAIGEQHRQLAALAGLWNVQQSLWLAPGQPPQTDAGTALFAMVLGGRHLQQDLRVASATPFQGLGYLGYDNVAHSYYASWMDINFTGLLLLHGDYDAASATWRFRGEMPGEGGAKVPVREELHVVDRNHVVARFFETREGKEALAVELDYTRP